MIVVAHKLSTVRNADIIAVISGGCIVEMGSREDLINKQNGHYAKLAKMPGQYGFDEAESNFEPHVLSSVTRSSAGRQSSTRSSPAIFLTPVPDEKQKYTASYLPPSFTRLLSLNSPEWKQGLIGSLSAVAFGAVQPFYALTIGGMIAAFFVPSHDEMRDRIRTYSTIFCSLTLISITLNLFQHYNFAYMGEHLTKRIRLKMLKKILTFETAWFDEEENSSGALSSRLNNEASMVKSLVADRLSLLIQTTSAVTIAMVMGLVVAWKLALVMIAVQPLTILCMYTRKVLLSGITTNALKAQRRSTQIAVEAVYNHRIVTSFGSAGEVLRLFDEAQEEPRRQGRKKSWLAGMGMGSAQCLTFMCWALDFWYGGKLVEKREITAGDVFKTFFILVSTGKVIADAGSMTSDLAKGSTAVASVFNILDRQSQIPVSNQKEDGSSGTKLEKITGRIEMKKIADLSSESSNFLPRNPPILIPIPMDQLFDLDEALTMAINNGDVSAVASDSSAALLDMPTVSASDDVCSVCMDDFRPDNVGKRVPCGHVYHAPCIADWIYSHNSCPLCRNTVCRRFERPNF
ncbi:hypothetical protein Ancab_016868 [Ancistrocladus abbreviatus]